ncbi:MAG: glycosyltransferase family 4 protein [Anaerolineales bacterium]
MNIYRIGFVLEQGLGHKTHSQNLQALLSREASIHPYWVLPNWQTEGLGSKIPIYKSNWTVQAGWQARQGIKEILNRTHLDGLFFHTQVPAVFSINWIQRIPSVISLDATPLQYDELGEAYEHRQGPAWLERLKYRLNRNALQAARHLVTWSEWAKDGLVYDYGIPEEKITVIPPGVNLRQWARPKTAAKFNQVVKILFVGGNLARKGGTNLLEAFHILHSQQLQQHNGKQPRIELHLVTHDNVEPGPDIFLHQHMQPNSPELKRLYHEADIFCLPTRGDCLPMALAEAGAASLPIVSTDVAAIPEFVHEDTNGFLIQPGDIRGLVDALQRLIEDPLLRKMMAAQSYRIVAAEHDAELNAMRLVQVLHSVVDNSPLPLAQHESGSANSLRYDQPRN